MRVVISNEGDHEPKGMSFMAVDSRGLLVDLSGVDGQLTDPTILRVEWGMLQPPGGGPVREGGLITQKDGGKRVFFERSVLAPYLKAYEARKAEIERPAAS